MTANTERIQAFTIKTINTIQSRLRPTASHPDSNRTHSKMISQLFNSVQKITIQINSNHKHSNHNRVSKRNSSSHNSNLRVSNSNLNSNHNTSNNPLNRDSNSINNNHLISHHRRQIYSEDIQQLGLILTPVHTVFRTLDSTISLINGKVYCRMLPILSHYY